VPYVRAVIRVKQWLCRFVGHRAAVGSYSPGMTKRSTVLRGHRLGYARVSTLEQDPALQLDALTAGVDEVFVDHASGVLTARPELVELMSRLRPGDTLVVWRTGRVRSRGGAG